MGTIMMMTFAVLLAVEGLMGIVLNRLVAENWVRDLARMNAKVPGLDRRILSWCSVGLGSLMLLFGVLVVSVAAVLDARSPGDLAAVLSYVEANWGVWMLPAALLSGVLGVGGVWGAFEVLRRLAPTPWWERMSRGPSQREILGVSLSTVLLLVGLPAAMAAIWFLLARSLASAVLPG